jgi:hypothetical protein
MLADGGFEGGDGIDAGSSAGTEKTADSLKWPPIPADLTPREEIDRPRPFPSPLPESAMKTPTSTDADRTASSDLASDVLAKIGPAKIGAAEAPIAGSPFAGESWEIPGCATTFRLDAEDFGAMSHLTDLRFAEDGLLASTVDWIDPGAQISLGFEASGQTARRGEVIACRGDGEVHRIAIRFEHRLAA